MLHFLIRVHKTTPPTRINPAEVGEVFYAVPPHFNPLTRQECARYNRFLQEADLSKEDPTINGRFEENSFRYYPCHCKEIFWTVLGNPSECIPEEKLSSK